MKAYEVIAKKVKDVGISNAELGRRIDMDSELVRRCLAGERKIIADEMVAFSVELGLEIDDFQKSSEEETDGD